MDRINLFNTIGLDLDVPELFSKNKNLVNWFDIPVTDLDRAVNFYEKVFQTKLTKHIENDRLSYWFPMNVLSTGTSGSLVKSQNNKPCNDGNGIIIYFTTNEVNDGLERVSMMGGKVLMTKTSIGKHGFIGMALDTEGNRIGLHSMK